MDDYISREATIKAFCEKCNGYYDGHCVHRGECDIDVIENAPSADVQPVVYAHKTINVGRRSYCSNCGKLAIMEDFCSKCGAKVKDGDAE